MTHLCAPVFLCVMFRIRILETFLLFLLSNNLNLMWASGMKPQLGAKVRNTQGLVGVVSKISGSMVYTDTFKSRGWKKGLEVWSTAAPCQKKHSDIVACTVPQQPYDHIYYTAFLSTAALWALGIYVLLQNKTQVLLMTLAVPYVEHGVALVVNETERWVEADAQFHGVCSTVRGRMLHPGACRMGMEESIVMGTFVINVFIHWCPPMARHVFATVLMILRATYGAFQWHVTMHAYVLKTVGM